MSNILEISGKPKDAFERKIKDMNFGEAGWAVEWAVQDGNLNTDFTVVPAPYGTADMKVVCIGKNKYAIEYVNKEKK